MNSYSKMKSGNGQKGCNAKLYAFPSENQFAHTWRMIMINKVDKGEEEVK